MNTNNGFGPLRNRCAVVWALRSTPAGETVDLRNWNLAGADLEGLDLRRADLRGANLYGANLNYCNLSGVNLAGAHLEEATLEGAVADGTFGANGDISHLLMEVVAHALVSNKVVQGQFITRDGEGHATSVRVIEVEVITSADDLLRRIFG